MQKASRFFVGCVLGVACAGAVAAQETAPAPKVMQITREFVKPGKTGMAHDKAESAFVKAMSDAKWPTYYVALSSLSGKSACSF